MKELMQRVCMKEFMQDQIILVCSTSTDSRGVSDTIAEKKSYAQWEVRVVRILRMCLIGSCRELLRELVGSLRELSGIAEVRVGEEPS